MIKKFLLTVFCCAFLTIFACGQTIDSSNPVLTRRVPLEEFAALDEDIDREPENQELYLKKAALYCQTNEKDRALLNIETAIHIDLQNDLILEKAAEQLFRCGLYDESMKIAGSMILKNPDGVIGYRLRFPIRYELQDYRGAIEDFIKGKGYGDEEIFRKKRWLKTLDKLKDDENIFRYYDQLSKWVNKPLPFSTSGVMIYKAIIQRDFYGSAAKTYFLRGRIKESEEFFRQMFEVYPSEFTLEQRAKIYAEIGKFFEAFADINTAINQIEEKQINLLSENKALAASNKKFQIEDNFRHIMNLDEIKSGFYITRGDFYILKRNFEKAISDYQTAISLNPQLERKTREKIILVQQEQENK